MTTQRRSQLFHAIVVAGVGLVGGCSRSLTNAADASVDRSADLATDLGTESTSTDVPPPRDAVCVCKDDGGDSCRQCTCGCFMPGDGGVCFPCYV